MFGRKRRRRKQREAEQDGHAQAARNPVIRVLTTDLVLRGASYALRQGVRRGLVGGKSAQVVPDHPPTVSTRLATAVATTVATRSVPGALVIGSGLIVRALYRRGLARRASQRAGDEG